MSRADDERPPKRRRVLSDAEDEPTRELQRDPLDISTSAARSSSCTRTCPRSAMCVLRSRGQSQARSMFACIGAVLASASRPLAAMLYGESRTMTPSAARLEPPAARAARHRAVVL